MRMQFILNPNKQVQILVNFGIDTKFGTNEKMDHKFVK